MSDVIKFCSEFTAPQLQALNVLIEKKYSRNSFSDKLMIQNVKANLRS